MARERVRLSLLYWGLELVDWTTERDTQLRQWRRDGFSYELIARKFTALGFNCSRGSAVGRAARIGLMGMLERHKKPKYGLASSNTHQRAAPAVPLPGQQARPVVASPTNAAAATGFLGIALIDLDQNQCRFPQGERPIVFCGQPVIADSSYCAKHHEICCGP